jgi:L-ascorbate metabolism protein UlaG (beta-lactamase superfamily)
MTAGTRPIRITWFGHSAFLLQDDRGASVLVDPWLDNPKSPVAPDKIHRPDLILITHGHCDHIGNAVDIAKRHDVRVVAIHEVSLYLSTRGVRSATGMNKGGTLETGVARVTMTHAVHSSDIDVGGEGKVLPGGEPAGYVIEFPGHPKVYHAGDTGVFGDMGIIRELYAPEIVILPIGGLYTMGPREAAMAVDLLRPRTVIGMHYGTFPALSGTPAGLRSHLPPRYREAVVELVPGTPVLFH